MSTVTRSIKASPPEVFAVLADGWAYSNWVVGTSHMRAVDSNWPAPGSTIYHAAGLWPLVVRDKSVVEAAEPDRNMSLIAKGRPFGEARVVIELEPDGDGTLVTMHETPIAGPGKWLHNPASEALLTRRNVEALARLAAIAERRSEPEDT
jgi:Polyketide cyclase / dehydrase and lipid transport